MRLEEAKSRACELVDELSDDLRSISESIHARPELGYEEVFAHECLVDAIRQKLPAALVEEHAYGLPTAFRADVGGDGPLVVLICEYDALPGIGHGCGHNIIAAAGAGAGMAIGQLASACGGRVRILGTPAEEGGGGKIRLAEAGAFEGAVAALMVHPAGANLRRMNAIAVQQIRVVYEGVAAHAAAAPHRGRNALDGAVLGYMNVAALRQHIRPDERIHGIFTEAGEKANIVPRRAAAQWYVRARDSRNLEGLVERVMRCLAAGADAAGVEVDLDTSIPAYAEMWDNGVLGELFVENSKTLGRVFEEPSALDAVVGSTDMGNVSQLVPAIHPMIAVSPAGVPIHTEEFASHCVGDSAHSAVLDGAKALATTAIDLWLGAGVLESVAASFEEDSRSRRVE